MLSLGRMRVRQMKQWLGGWVRLRPRGRRAMQTLRKLPRTQPSTKRNASRAANQRWPIMAGDRRQAKAGPGSRRRLAPGPTGSAHLGFVTAGDVEVRVLLAEPLLGPQFQKPLLGGGRSRTSFHGSDLASFSRVQCN